MGGSGAGYGRGRGHLTEEEIRRRHRAVDGDAYIFDAEYEKLKREQERLEREYERARERYLRITEDLRQEMLNGTASDTDMARFMSALTDRGVQLQQEQAKMQDDIDKLTQQRTDLDNQMNDLRSRAFAGATRAQTVVRQDREYNGFKADEKRYADARIIEMSPQEYLRRVAFGRDGTGSIQALLQSAPPAMVERYMRQMLRGTKYNAPILGGRGSSERNTARVVAALMNGFDRIPVMVIE